MFTPFILLLDFGESSSDSECCDAELVFGVASALLVLGPPESVPPSRSLAGSCWLMFTTTTALWFRMIFRHMSLTIKAERTTSDLALRNFSALVKM